MKDWRKSKLGDIAVISYGYTAKASIENVGSKFLRITDIQNDMVNWSSVPYCPVNEDDFKKYKLIDQDIVFARTGATTGKSYLVCDPPEAVAASYLIRLRLKDPTIDAKFISKYFQTKEYWDNIFSGISGSAQGGFNASKLSELVIPIPPLPEQKRIVAIADEAFEGIDKAIRNTEKNLSNARELFESYLNTIFTQKGDGWEEKKLGDISTISYGYTEKASREPIGHKFLRITDIQNNQVNWKTVPFCTISEKDYIKHKLCTGDIVFARTGATTGKSFLVINPPDAVCASYLIRLSLKSDDLMPEFLILYFQTKQYQEIISLGISGSAQGGFNASKLADIVIPLAMNSEQVHIVNRAKELLEQTQQLETIYRQKIAALKELKQSILQKAFTGELTADTVKTEREAIAV